MEHDIKRLEEKIRDLEGGIANLARLPPGFGVVIHKPGWTTVSEYGLVDAGLDAVQTQVETASEHLKRLIAAAGLVGSNWPSPWPTPGAITGRVVEDTDGGFLGLSGAHVSAAGDSTTTDGGIYTLTNLQPGPTTVTASLPAHFSRLISPSQEEESVTVISGQTVTLDFVFVRKGTTM